MNRFANLIASALVLSWGTSPRASHRELSASVPATTPALASAPSPKTPEGMVHRQLVAPLAARDADRSQFSRARLPPRALRVRLLDDALVRTDAAGDTFVSFAIDECHGRYVAGKEDLSNCEWHEATISGCVYAEKSAVFVARGKATYPASFMIGTKVNAVADFICHDEPKTAAKGA